MLRACRRILRPGGRTAFFTIHPATGLTATQRRRASRDGPIAVATARPNDPGTTPHVHSEHDDMSFVIEGALTYEIAGETHEAPAGTFVLVPRGATHRWWNPHPEPATFLNVHIAGHGFESFIQELSALSAAGHATREAMAELGERHDVYFEFSGVNTPSS